MMLAFPDQNQTEKWCNQIVDTFQPINLLFVSRAALITPDKFAELGIVASTYQWQETDQRYEYKSPEGISFAERQEHSWEIVVFHQEALEDFLSCSKEAFERLFGNPETVLILLSSSYFGASLPEVALRFVDFGYTHKLDRELWIDGSLFTAIYEKKELQPGLILKNYEASWWQLAQMSQKRRMLLIEYMDELVLSELRLSQKNEAIKEYEQRCQVTDAHVAVLQNEVQLRVDYILNLEQEYHQLKRQNQSIQEKYGFLISLGDKFQNSWLGKFARIVRKGRR